MKNYTVMGRAHFAEAEAKTSTLRPMGLSHVCRL